MSLGKGQYAQRGDPGNPWAVSGFQRLATSVLTAGAPTIPSVAFPPRDLLLVLIRITGYANLDRPQMQFNGDTGLNYWSRWITVAPAGVALANVQTPSSAGVHIAGNDVTTGRVVRALIANRLATPKTVSMDDHTATGAVATIQTSHVAGGGEWVNTAAQITSMQITTVQGRNLNTGSGFAVFGRNIY